MKVTISSAQKRKTFSVRRCGFRQDRCGNTDTRPHKFCSALQYFVEFYNVLWRFATFCNALTALCGAPWSFTMFCGTFCHVLRCPDSALRSSVEFYNVLWRFATLGDALTVLCEVPWSIVMFCGALPRSAMPWQCSAEFRGVLQCSVVLCHVLRCPSALRSSAKFCNVLWWFITLGDFLPFCSVSRSFYCDHVSLPCLF